MKILLSQPNKKMYCKKKQIVVVTDYKAQNNSFLVLEAKISILCAGLKSRFQYESSSSFQHKASGEMRCAHRDHPHEI